MSGPEAWIGRPWPWLIAGVVLGLVAASRQREPEKSQVVRGVDVLILGPFMAWLGLQRRQLLPGSRAMLALVGGATVTYNAVNFMRSQRGSDSAGKA